MHWTIENPRREIPRQTPLAQIDIRRWEAILGQMGNKSRMEF